jgi:hypothetical protein
VPAATVAALAGIGSLLAAAKCHGRQVRLRREAEGVLAVDFRADNGPVVEGIWRRDRRLLWLVAAALAAAALAGWWSSGLPAWWLAPAAGWAATVAFLLVGLGWAVALGRRTGAWGRSLAGWLAWAGLAAGLAMLEAWLLA